MGVMRRFLSRDWSTDERDFIEKCSVAKETNRVTPHNNKLPPLLHQTLNLDWMPRDGRLVVIGDVHGCRKDLEALLNKIGIRPRKDCLTFVGDLVNKGPDSCGVIDIAMQYGAICVRGNHDDTALNTYTNRHSTLNSNAEYMEKNKWAKVMTRTQATYLSAMPFTLSIPELNIVIVHAGLVPGVPLGKQNLADLYKMRYLRKKWTKWEAQESLTDQCVRWADVWSGPEHVIFGHDAVKGLQLKKYATGIDTACVYGGKLSACVIPAGKLLKKKHRLSKSIGAALKSWISFDPTRKNLQMEIISVPSTSTATQAQANAS